jgi:hypothetical protein
MEQAESEKSFPILVRYRNRDIRATDIEFIQATILAHPKMGRTHLSRLLCEIWDWRQPNLGLKEYACRDLLLRLEEWGHLKLPAKQRKRNGQKKKISSEVINLGPTPELIESGDLKKLVVRPVCDRKERLLWRALMDRYHYLGEGVMCGEHILYVATLPIDSGEQIVACLGFGSASLRNPARDQVMGWEFEATRRELPKITNNLRFLILPWVKIKNLGSRILSLNLNRLPSDWEEKYGHGLIAVETFVDQSKFRGTVYKAANWTCIGQTAGRQKRGNAYPQIGQGSHGQSKAIYLYGLNQNTFKKIKLNQVK